MAVELTPKATAFLATPAPIRPRPAALDAEARWHPVFVSPLARSAERVEEFIARLGFALWWPKMTVLEKRRKRNHAVLASRRTAARYTTTAVQRPLWPRYVLIRLPRQDAPFGRLSDDQARAFGIWGVLRAGDGPAVIPDGAVADLQAREAAGEWDRTTRHGRRLVNKAPEWAVIGSAVEVTDGPFASFEATIEELVGDRAKVAVSIFGRATPVDLHLSQIHPSRS